MKNSIFVSALAISIFFAQTVHAQMTAEKLAEYKKSLESESAAGIAFEMSKHGSFASWYCGADFASQMSTDIQSGRTPKLPANASTDCRTEASLFKVAFDVAINQTKAKATGETLAVVAPPRKYSFIMRVPQLNKRATATSGEGFCLDTAKELFAKWSETETLPFGSFASLKSEQTFKCQITRNGRETWSHFGCDQWMMSSDFNFDTGDIALPTSSVTKYTTSELAEFAKMRKRIESAKAARKELSIEEMVRDLDFHNNAGIQFFGVITTRVGAKNASFEVRGVPKPDWNRSVLGLNGAPILRTADVPASCSVKTDFDIYVGPVLSGRLQ